MSGHGSRGSIDLFLVMFMAFFSLLLSTAVMEQIRLAHQSIYVQMAEFSRVSHVSGDGVAIQGHVQPFAWPLERLDYGAPGTSRLQESRAICMIAESILEQQADIEWLKEEFPCDGP